MIRYRSAPLKAAAILAVGFIVLRLGYRALFNGLDGAGLVLLDLPTVRLAPPLAHIALLGPITTGGVQTAVLSALPIALVILAFGLLNAVVDVSRLFARGARSGPLRGLSRALVIAWATFPALTDAVASVRVARRLRAERGVAALLVPLFERTVERAVAVAATMEVRGFAAGHPVDGVCEKPVVLSGAGIGYPEAGGSSHAVHWMLRGLDLDLSTGSLTVIAGPTGSGKTSLLHALSGLLTHVDGGVADGLIEVGGVDRLAVPPRDTAGFVGVVLQQPRLGFASETVGDEIGFALDVRGVAPGIVATRVAEVAAHVGIAHLVGRDIRALSAGEATLVAIAAAIVERPTLLLVDEPLADLDLDARARIVALLGSLAHEAGVCVVVAEHRVAELAGVADAVLPIAERPVVDAGAVDRQPGPPIAGSHASGTPPIAVVRGLGVTHACTPAVIDAALDLRAGEIVAITGANGAGKSSLLAGIALPTASGTVVVDGSDVAALRPRARRRLVALMPDESDDLLFATTVAAECRRADREARLPVGTTESLFVHFLGPEVGRASSVTADVAADATGSRDAPWRTQHPRDLSTGERRLLALAIQLAAAPRVLLVDEPTRGLDDAARGLVADALRAAAHSGTAVVIATHDRAFAAAVTDRALPMADGRLGTGADRSEQDDSRASVAPATSSPAEPGASATRSGQEERGRSTAPSGPARSARRPSGRPTLRWQPWLLTAGSLLAAAAFAWPLLVPALPAEAQAAAPYAAIALLPFVLAAIALTLDGEVRSAKTLALLGTLTAIGAAVRIVGTGVGGVEAVFVLLILAGRAFGARFGFLLGILTIALSSTMWGGFGPWTPFQMFACGWVGAGAGLLPRWRVSGPSTGSGTAVGSGTVVGSGAAGSGARIGEIAMLAVYGAVASYAFGLVMNLWFWPFAVGTASGIAYVPGAPLAQNAGSFLLYTLVTSTLTWDTLRAITSVIGVVVAGPAVLAALRRAKLGPQGSSASRRSLRSRLSASGGDGSGGGGSASGGDGTTQRSTSPRGGGRRTHPSTAPDAAAAPPTARHPSARA